MNMSWRAQLSPSFGQGAQIPTAEGIDWHFQEHATRAIEWGQVTPTHIDLK